MKHISVNSAESDNPHRDRTPARKGRFYVQRFILILLLILLLPLSSSVAKNVTCSRLPLLMKSFLANHYAMKDLTGEVKDHAVDQMIKIIDPTKTLLYESDVASLKPFLRRVFASIQAGDCAALTPVYDILVARARENEAMVRKILGSDFKLDEKAQQALIQLLRNGNYRPLTVEHTLAAAEGADCNIALYKSGKCQSISCRIIWYLKRQRYIAGFIKMVCLHQEIPGDQCE